MEDVLLNHRDTRKPASPISEPGTWVAPLASTLGAPPKVGLPYPLSGLFALAETHRDYPAGCAALGDFLKSLCGTFPLEGVLLQAMQARFPRVWMERFLFILLDTEPSDWQTAGYVLQFRHLKRLLLRVERKTPLNAAESGLARELIAALSLSGFPDFEPFCRQAAETFRVMQAGRIPVSGDLGLLVYLIRCECTAMGERKNWLEDSQGAGDPDTIARLSPHLLLLESRMLKAKELAQRLGSYGPIQEAAMGLEEAMGPFFFSHLRNCLARSPALAGLKRVLELQQAKRVPTRDLIALSTLCRWALEARGAAAGPLEWVRMALEAYDRGHFRLDVAGSLPAVQILLAESKVEREGTMVLGNFGENPYHSWIARDGLTRPFRSSNPDRIAPDLRSLVLGNLHRDTVILKLLDNPKVAAVPGLIEAVVEGSRSSLVHGKIASRKDLHAGPDARVPLALLRSQVSIPASMIRSLLHPSVLSAAETQALHRDRPGLRQEVAEELRLCLNRANPA